MLKLQNLSLRIGKAQVLRDVLEDVVVALLLERRGAETGCLAPGRRDERRREAGGKSPGPPCRKRIPRSREGSSNPS